MNRYSLLFAMLVAVSFVTPTPHTADTSGAARQTGKPVDQKSAGNQPSNDFGIDPTDAFNEFWPNTPQHAAALDAKVLFATVPHPTETHLAADFDEDVAAIQHGLQDSGYIFDAAWIPWEVQRVYDQFADDDTEKQAIEQQDRYPGILFFRKASDSSVTSPASDPYEHGLIVFLITEKPTAGLAIEQVSKAIELLKAHGIAPRNSIKIVGPSFSGSLDSLARAVKLLHEWNPTADFLIRSGGIVGGQSSTQKIAQIAADLPANNIDFGSTHHDYSQWAGLVEEKLSEMGIALEYVVFLNEGETTYGTVVENHSRRSGHKQKPAGNTYNSYESWENSEEHDRVSAESWHIPYPRDISALRLGYERQGIFDDSSSIQPWKRYLNLKSDEENEGDSVRSFGGQATIATQESTLLGISEFVKMHNIRAVVISATNSMDTYFLSQFFHANNSGVRVVNVGGSRLFLRGATAQFRGDLIVDDFPLLSRLNDWTAGSPEPNKPWSYTEHIFTSDYSQGAYLATIDLMAEPDFPNNAFRVFPNYAPPDWGADRPPQVPPMYMTALGGEAAWPVAMHIYPQMLKGSPKPAPSTAKQTQSKTGSWSLEMPFLLFGHNGGQIAPDAPRGTHPGASHLWKDLFAFLWLIVISYCVAFFYANPLSRRLCASFEPAADWRYWLFTVAIPATIAGWAFQVVAAPLDLPVEISFSISLWWWVAMGSSMTAPVLIAFSAWRKARKDKECIQYGTKYLFLTLPILVALCFAVFHLWNFCGRPSASEIGTALNMYREMHWESGLSLIPTWLLILFAVFLWTRQASQSTALFLIPPVLPIFPGDNRISRCSSNCMDEIGRPIPDFRSTRWLWRIWGTGVVCMLAVVSLLPAFRAITTLERHSATLCLVYASTVIVSIMLLDISQFIWLWSELRKLLRALDSHVFRRSFVPIDDFKWPSFWSFGGVSFYDQRVILTAVIDGAEKLADAPFYPLVSPMVDTLVHMRAQYRSTAPPPSIAQYRADLSSVFQMIAKISSEIANQMELGEYPEPRQLSFEGEVKKRSLACNCEKKSRFSEEAEAAACLLPWQQASEKVLCLTYIAFIQTVIARLHGLMLSIAGIFSIVASAIAVYPFTPMSPFYLCGFTILPLLAWAFYHVFSQMDTDPILSRIVDGDDRKLAWNFYGKFAESLALPVLTLLSSVLPGGSGRVLDLAQKLLSHGQ